jgi:hypothetical protein
MEGWEVGSGCKFSVVPANAGTHTA